MKLTKIRIPTFCWNSRLGITTMSPLSWKYFHKRFWVGNELSFNILGTQLSQCKGKEMWCIQFHLWSVTLWNHIISTCLYFNLSSFPSVFGAGKWPGLSRVVDELAGFPWQPLQLSWTKQKAWGLKLCWVGMTGEGRQSLWNESAVKRLLLGTSCWNVDAWVGGSQTLPFHRYFSNATQKLKSNK